MAELKDVRNDYHGVSNLTSDIDSTETNIALLAFKLTIIAPITIPSVIPNPLPMPIPLPPSSPNTIPKTVPIAIPRIMHITIICRFFILVLD